MVSIRLVLVKFCLLACFIFPQGSAQEALPWQWSNPQPHGNHIYDLALHNGIYIAVGDRGRIYTSDNLDTWTHVPAPTTATLRSIAFMGNRTLISGSEGTILYSDDLRTFTHVNLGTGAWLEGIAASPTLAVAVGDAGAIYSSADGANWTARPSGTDQWLTSVAFGPTGIFAVGENGTILSSANGATWQAAPGRPSVTNHLNNIALVNGALWTVGESGFTASMGTRGWSVGPTLGTNDLFSITGSANEWLVVGDRSVYLKTGAFGAWQSQVVADETYAAPAWPYYSALWDGRLYLVGGRGGFMIEGFRAGTSSPMQWYRSDESLRNWLWSVTTMPNLTVAVGRQGTIMTSEDGVFWDSEAVPITDSSTVLLGVGGRTNLLVAVGSGGTIVTSPEAFENLVTTNTQGQLVTNLVNVFGLRWHKVNSGTTTDLQGVGTDGTTVVVSGGNGTLLRSANGTSWGQVSSGVTTFLSSVAHANGVWVAVGDNGTLLTSGDAQSWTRRNLGTTNWIYQVRALNGGFVAVGENGTILTSAAGFQWQPQNQGFRRYTGWIYDVTHVGGTYYAVGARGATLQSADGVTWSNVGSITSHDFYGVTVTSSGQLIAVGTEGAILRAQAVPFTTPVQISSFDKNGSSSAFLFTGAVDQRFTLQSSFDLQTWTNRATLQITDESGTLLHVQADSSGAEREFFRTRLIQ